MGRGSTGSKPTIAVFNSSEDTVELLRTALEAEGFQTGRGAHSRREEGATST